MKRANILMILSLNSLIGYNVAASATNLQKSDSICTHQIVRNTDGKMLSWYKPETNGAGYDHVINTMRIAYRTFLPASTEVLRLKGLPKQITVDGKALKRVNDLTTSEGWNWEKLKDGGILHINHMNGRDVEIINE